MQPQTALVVLTATGNYKLYLIFFPQGEKVISVHYTLSTCLDMWGSQTAAGRQVSISVLFLQITEN